MSSTGITSFIRACHNTLIAIFFYIPLHNYIIQVKLFSYQSCWVYIHIFGKISSLSYIAIEISIWYMDRQSLIAFFKYIYE